MVFYVQWSPNGQYIATTSRDNTARIWDATTKKELHRLPHPDADTYVGSFAWSPDSQYIVTGGRGGKAHIWDVSTGRLVTESVLRPNPNFLFSFGWSPDGTRIAGFSYPDYVTIIWDVKTSQIITTVGDGSCFMYPAWSPQGDRFVTGCWYTAADDDNPPVTIWTADGQEVMKLESHNGESVRSEWSPDGKRIAITYEDGTVKIWDASTGKDLLTFSGHQATANQATWSPDGRRMASGDDSGIVKVWDATTADEVMSFQMPGGAFTLDWSPDVFLIF